MPRGPNWKPISLLRRQVRLLRDLHFKHVKLMTRKECEKFLAYFGPLPTGGINPLFFEMPTGDGKIVELESSDSDEYDD